ncbi:MAG TPA: hypothetical protein VGB44_09440 [Flavobacterium sp.]|jgi:hypothetical protein
MKIAEEHIPYTYKESKRIYEQGLSTKEAAENIFNTCGIKIGSAKDYPYYFRYLMTGSGSCRSLSSFTQEYYLKHILNDYGRDQLEKSLKFFITLIIKFERKNNLPKKAMRQIYEKYFEMLHIN